MNRQHLLQLSAELDQVIQFDYQDEDEKKSHLIRNTALVGGAGLAGAGGLYAAGTLGAGRTMANTYGDLKHDLGTFRNGGASNIGATISEGAKKVGNYAGGVGGAVKEAAGDYSGLRQAAQAAGGSISRTKAAGGALSGLWSKLKGVKFISRHQSLVQLSAELDDVVEFKGGYVNTDEGVKKERGVGSHFNRAAGRYIGSAVVTPLVGLPVGYFIDRSRAKHNKLLTSQEPEVSGSLKRLISK